MNGIKPCLFCESKCVVNAVDPGGYGNNDEFEVSCFNCCYCSPHYNTREEAVTTHNRRWQLIEFGKQCELESEKHKVRRAMNYGRQIGLTVGK